MNFVDRIKGILLEPKNEWPKIAAEPATVQSIYTGWVMILGAIGPIALLISTGSVVAAIGQYLITLLVTYVLAWIIDALSPSFGGTKDFVSALKLAAYSYTAAWLAGILNLLGVLGSILVLIASIYAWYTFFLGAPILRKCAPEKAVVYTIVVVLCGIGLGIVLGLLFATVGFGPKLPMSV